MEEKLMEEKLMEEKFLGKTSYILIRLAKGCHLVSMRIVVSVQGKI